MTVNSIFARTAEGVIYERSTWAHKDTGQQVGLITQGYPAYGYEPLPGAVEVPDLLSALRACYDACEKNQFYTGPNFSTRIILPAEI